MKIKKVIIILIITLITLNTICYADIDTGTYRPADLASQDYQKAFDMAGTIVTGIRTVGMVIAFVGVMILGIKYMIGSVEQKAEYKKTMIPYLVGCILLFTITLFVSILYSLAIYIR